MKLDKAFPETPKAFEDAIHLGIRKGEKQMKFKYKLRLSVAAACLAVCLIAVAYAVGTSDKTDTTVTGQPHDSQTTVSSNVEPSPTPGVVVFPSPTPENAGWPDIETNEKKVYTTEFGIWYHDDPTCQGMQNAMLIPISEAREEQKLPCPICIGETVYATANGRFYHSDPNCSGMKNAGEWKESDAQANGKLPCPVCLSDRSIDLSDYRQRALDRMNDIFPGCVETIANHYNVDQLYVQIQTDTGIVHTAVSANAVTVAEISFTGNEAYVTFFFNDVEIRGKVFSCLKEDALSNKLVNLYTICKEELLGSLLTAIHDSAKSNMPVNGEYYNLRSMALTCYEDECECVTFSFATKYYCEAAFTFDLVESDSLSLVELKSQ